MSNQDHHTSDSHDRRSRRIHIAVLVAALVLAFIGGSLGYFFERSLLGVVAGMILVTMPVALIGTLVAPLEGWLKGRRRE